MAFKYNKVVVPSSHAVRAVPAVEPVPVGAGRGGVRRQDARHRDGHVLLHFHHRRIHHRKVSPHLFLTSTVKNLIINA